MIKGKKTTKKQEQKNKQTKEVKLCSSAVNCTKNQNRQASIKQRPGDMVCRACLSESLFSRICSHGQRTEKKEPITQHRTRFNTLYHAPWTSKASWDGCRTPEDDQGLSCVWACSFCELMRQQAAHGSQIKQDDGSIQMTQFIMITMMVVPQWGSGLMNQAQSPVRGCSGSSPAPSSSYPDLES